jgi:hypothetical protein
MNDHLMQLLDQQVKDSIELNDLDGVAKYLNDLQSLINSYKHTVKLTRDKLNQITDDEVTAITSRLDAAFPQVTWEHELQGNTVVFTGSFKDVELDVRYYFKSKSNRSWSNSYTISGYFYLDKSGDTEVLLIDKGCLQSIDEVINYIFIFFLRLRESVNYLEVNNADSIIHTIAD